MTTAHTRANLCPAACRTRLLWLGREMEKWLERGEKQEHPSALKKDLIFTAGRTTRVFLSLRVILLMFLYLTPVKMDSGKEI